MTQKTIFNHDIMTCTHEEVSGNYLYSGRVLGMTEPEDIIQLHPALKSQWNAITNHYGRIGLSHSQHILWNVSRNVMEDFPDYEKSVFFFGHMEKKADLDREWFRKVDEDWFNVVDFMNSKNNFMQLAEELGVIIPKTLCVKNKAALKNHLDLPYPCYLKPAVSVSGVGITRCEDEQQLNQALQSLGDDIPLQIQEEVIASNFLNLQYSVTDGEAERLAASEQILNGCVHMGNRYPTAHQPWETIEPMAEWMTKQGMKGIFGFDVAVVEEATGTRYLGIECNPRFNGASYPTGVANKLNIASWSSEALSTKHRSLDDIDLSDIEFNPENGTGVIIVNWGSILVGKIGVLIAGPKDKQLEVKTKLKNRL